MRTADDKGAMRNLPWILPVVLLACNDDNRATEAEAAFNRFQTALLRGDRATVRELLTRESRPVTKSLPWRELASMTPLEVLGVTENHGRFEIAVRDPNRDSRESLYVVVREDSRWRVDLLATTSHNHSYYWNKGATTIVRPGVIETDGIRRIGASEASSIR